MTQFSSKQFISILKVAVPIIGALGFAAYTLGYFSKSADQTVITKGKTESAQADQKEEKRTGKKKIDLATGSREDVLELLNDVLTVQKQLSTLMDSTVEEIVNENLDLPKVYQRIYTSQPEDPLDSHGLSIADFDALLDRFSVDDEVHAMVVAVIKGPEPASDNADERQTDVQPDRIIEINAAMKERLRSAAAELKESRSKLSMPFNSRAASLTVQAIVGAYVRKEFNVTADDVERAMVLFQYELSQRPDFMKINDEIQEMMQQIMNISD